MSCSKVNCSRCLLFSINQKRQPTFILFFMWYSPLIKLSIKKNLLLLLFKYCSIQNTGFWLYQCLLDNKTNCEHSRIMADYTATHLSHTKHWTNTITTASSCI